MQQVLKTDAKLLNCSDNMKINNGYGQVTLVFKGQPVKISP